MSKPAGLLRFERLRIRFWIYLVSIQHGGEDAEIDSALHKELGFVFSPERRAPKATESFRKGHAPRKSLRGLSMHDFVKAATRMLGNDAAERMFYSNIWLTVLPRKRTMPGIVKAIRYLLRRYGLWRMPGSDVYKLLRWRYLCSGSPSAGDTHFASWFSAEQLRDLTRQGLISEEDWSMLLVLLHQEAFLSCLRDDADRLRALALPHAITTIRRFFRKAPLQLRAEVRSLEKALFYPQAKILETPREVIRGSKYVGGLVLPHLHDDRGNVVRRPSHHQVWALLHKIGPRGGIGGTG